MDNTQQEINLVDFVKLLIVHKTIVLGCVVAGILVSLLIVFYMPRDYRVETVVRVGQDGVNAEQKPIFIQDANGLVSEINFSISQKYPSMTASYISDGLFKITDSSPNKDKALKEVSDVVATIITRDNSFKDNLTRSMNSLKSAASSLAAQNANTYDANIKLFNLQEIETLNNRIFDIQNALEIITPTQALGHAVFSKKGFNPIVDVVLGALIGCIVGILAIGVKEWWLKNKTIFSHS